MSTVGVFNVVTGPGSFGQMIATHPGVDKVGFTGSTQVRPSSTSLTSDTGEQSVVHTTLPHPSPPPLSLLLSKVGQKLRRAIAGSGKKISLELGGKSPFIVYDSADLDSSVEGVVDAIFFNQGQVTLSSYCMSQSPCSILHFRYAVLVPDCWYRRV